MPSTVVSLRVTKDQAERLRRKARRLGRPASETGAILLEESLRRDEFAFIDFRDSPGGRQAHLLGTRLSVWMVVSRARSFHGDVQKTAAYFQRSPAHIQAALNYAKAFPEEIEASIRDNEVYDFARISQMLPQARVVAAHGKKPSRK